MTITALHDYIRKIEQLLEEGHFPEAENHCRHILAHYPRHLDTYRVLAKALLEQHRYEDAADLFQRVLSADPNDLVAHVGLADIYRHESLLDQSLWHLERAFELEPYNHVIQDEIRQLYVKHNNLAREVATSATRDVVGDVVLDRVPLNQAALAHIYLKGELYREAINEVRQVLAMQPMVAQPEVAEDRVDLEVVLAEALWRDEQRIDAAEVCQHILHQLPSCVMANAILGDILLQTGRAGEARQYLRRVQALTQVDSNHLDLETSVGHAFSQEGAPPLPQAVTIELLEITPDEVAPATSPSPAPTADWVREVVQPSVAQPEVADGAGEQPVAEAPDAEHEYDWLAGVVDMQSFEDSGQVADALPIEDADEVWQPEAEEKVDTDWFADSSILEETETADGQPEDVQSEIGALPDWLAELNEAAEPALSAAEVSAELDFDDVTDLSGEGESMEPADLDDFEPDTSEIPTWLRGQATTDEPVHSDIPDWLSKDVGDGDVASETAPGEEAAVPPEMPGWLTDVTSVDDLEPVEADPRLASDWFGDLEEEEGDLQPESPASTDVQPPVADDDWLAELASSTAELDDTTDEEALAATDDMQPEVAQPEVAQPEVAQPEVADDDWLAALARDTGELPEQPAMQPEVADEAAAAEFFDWMPEEAGDADYMQPPVADEVAEWLLGGDLAEQTEWEEGVMGDMQPELPKKDSDQQDGPE
ncbi:MAG TPA: tetratricopeptide repeat protein, partial [Anaerolineae bacterium]